MVARELSEIAAGVPGARRGAARSASAIAAAAVVALVLAGLSGIAGFVGVAVVGTAGAQPAPVQRVGFPAPLVAPVAPGGGGPELAVNDLYLADSVDPLNPDVVVRFREPFPLPAGTYRVAVLVGDPTGARLRASLVSTASTTKGTLELSEGSGWRDAGTTQASFDPSGLVVVRVPIAKAPLGNAVWVEVSQGQGSAQNLGAPALVTPYFARDALLATATPGTVPSGTFGRVSRPDGTVSAEVAPLPLGPVLTVVNRNVSVAYREPPPPSLLGQPVVEVIDSLLIAPSFEGGGAVAHFIRINRTDGTIGLYDGFSVPPADRSGDRSWIVKGLPADPGASPTVWFDLRALADVLGLEIGPDSVGMGVRRSFALADGRIVTADAVLATPAWLDLVSQVAAPVPPTTTKPGTAPVTDTSVLPIAIGAGSGAVLVMVVIVVVWSRARRRGAAEPAVDEDAGADRDGTDDALAGALEPAPAADDGLTLFERLRKTAPVPVVEVEPVTADLFASAPPRARRKRQPRGVVIAGEEVAKLVASASAPADGAPKPVALDDDVDAPAVVAQQNAAREDEVAHEDADPREDVALEDSVYEEAVHDDVVANETLAHEDVANEDPREDVAHEDAAREDEVARAPKLDPNAALAAFDREFAEFRARRAEDPPPPD